MDKNNFPFLQWSYFVGGNRDEQYVVRADTLEDLKRGQKDVYDLIDFPAVKKPLVAKEPVVVPVTETPVAPETKPETKTKTCQCGQIKNLRTGVKNGKRWAGWFCDDKQCAYSPEWIPLGKR